MTTALRGATTAACRGGAGLTAGCGGGRRPTCAMRPDAGSSPARKTIGERTIPRAVSVTVVRL
eukprot:6103783-Prymnesium_polylepis.1